MGIDLGTTNVKAVIYEAETFKPVASGEAGHYKIISEYMNWAEQDGNIWWEDTQSAIRQAINAFPYASSEIAAISLSSQGMGVLPIDKNGNPVDRAQIWMDRRGIQEAKDIEEWFGKDRVMECFGVRSDPYYQLTNILWLKRNRPEVWAKTWKICLANSFLSYKLTGELAQDECQAVMSMCYDIRYRCWSRELGDLLDIDFEAIQPKVMKSEEILGTIPQEIARITGLAAGTPVLVGGVDGGMALFEMGLVAPGDACEITGTSSNSFFASNVMPPPDSTISFFDPVVPTEAVPKLLFAPTNTTGENVRWYRNLVGLNEKNGPDGTPIFQYLDHLAASSSAGCRGLYYYPYLMGERAPLWNNDVRGMYIGATCNTNQADMLRAIYEGTSFAQKEIFDEFERVSGMQTRNLRISGGCARSETWMKIKASILNKPLDALYSGGGAPTGNAMLAGYTMGFYPDLGKTMNEFFHADRTYEPVKEWVSIYQDMYPIFCSMRNHLLEDLHASARIFKKN